MKILNEREFKEETKEGLVLVDFFATWCAPCRMMGMILEEAEEEISKYAKIVKVNVDESEKLARSFGIMSIPTLIILKNGKEVYKHVGLMQKEDLLDLLKSFN